MIDVGSLVQFSDADPEEWPDMWRGVVIAKPDPQTATVYWNESLILDQHIADFA